MNWPKTPLTQRLRIRYPIIQAPMAGGPTTPQLVAAVSNAGGLGSLAAGLLAPEDIRAAIGETRALTERPFAVNLFVAAPPAAEPERIERATALLAPYYQELGLPQPAPYRPDLSVPDFAEQLAVVIEEGVDVFSFTFGVPRPEQLAALRERGIAIVGTATHVLEAIVLEESGIDMIVAQGFEAGGHRGTFLGRPEQDLVGTLALVPLITDHVRIPVVAAGGIMDGRGIVAALALGAAGAQMGTAFLACPESGAHPSHKQALRQGTEIATTLTRAFSGKPARGLRNRFIDQMDKHVEELPGYPAQDLLTRELRRAAARQNRPELMSLWAGQGCALAADRPAAELISRWAAEAEALIARL